MNDEYIYKRLLKLSEVIEEENFYRTGIPVLGAIGKEWWLSDKEQGIYSEELGYIEIIEVDDGILGNNRYLKITSKGNLFLETYDSSWKAKLNQKFGKYPYLHSIYGHIITFFLSICGALIINHLTK